MKFLKLLAFGLFAVVGAARAENLIVYFSETGNTERLATTVYENVGGDVARIEPVSPYPVAYDERVEIALREQAENARPKYNDLGVNVDDYDTVFLGYPVWLNGMPMIIYTFLEDNNFAGKTIIPFNTYGGEPFGNSIEEIKRLAPRATVTEGFALRGGETLQDHSESVKDWLRKIGKL